MEILHYKIYSKNATKKHRAAGIQYAHVLFFGFIMVPISATRKLIQPSSSALNMKYCSMPALFTAREIFVVRKLNKATNTVRITRTFP